MLTLPLLLEWRCGPATIPVFPAPVCACTRASRPSNWAQMAAIWKSWGPFSHLNCSFIWSAKSSISLGVKGFCVEGKFWGWVFVDFCCFWRCWVPLGGVERTEDIVLNKVKLIELIDEQNWRGVAHVRGWYPRPLLPLPRFSLIFSLMPPQKSQIIYSSDIDNSSDGDERQVTPNRNLFSLFSGPSSPQPPGSPHTPRNRTRAQSLPPLLSDKLVHTSPIAGTIAERKATTIRKSQLKQKATIADQQAQAQMEAEAATCYETGF